MSLVDVGGKWSFDNQSGIIYDRAKLAAMRSMYTFLEKIDLIYQWKVIEDIFVGGRRDVKYFKTEEEAFAYAKVCNLDCDVWTTYEVEQVITEHVRNNNDRKEF